MKVKEWLPEGEGLSPLAQPVILYVNGKHVTVRTVADYLLARALNPQAPVIKEKVR